MATPAHRLEHALVALLRLGSLPRVHERLVHRAAVRVERGPYIALATIGDAGSLRLSDVAKRLGLDMSTASRHVTRLCEDGLLHRTTDPTDHRAAQLTLSPAGRRALDGVRRARNAALAELLAEWDPSDIERLARDIDRLTTDLLQHLDPEGGD